MKVMIDETYLHVHMLGAGRVHGQVGEVDVGLQRGGELHLRLLRRLAHALQSHVVLGQVDALERRKKRNSSVKIPVKIKHWSHWSSTLVLSKKERSLRNLT